MESDISDEESETRADNVSVQELLNEKKKSTKKQKDYPGLFD